jgi:protein involved in polysaccharide export with SLBB domain
MKSKLQLNHLPIRDPRPLAGGSIAAEMSLTSVTASRAVLLAALITVSPASFAWAQDHALNPRIDSVRPGDVLRLRIWREPDMSGEYPVDQTGQAVLPRLGPLNLASVRADSLQSVLTDKYKTYLNNPSIEVILLRRVTVIGAVRTPGVYQVEPSMSISDAVALAGGPAPDGKRDKVEIIRRGKRVVGDLRHDALIADTPVRSGDEIYVPQKAWISRNPWVFSAALTLVAIIIRDVNN